MPVDRRERILILLQTRDAFLPEPVRHVEYRDPGFVHGARERTCPDCLANGRVLKTCETCAGRGVVAEASPAIAAPDETGPASHRDPYLDPKLSEFDVSAQAARDRARARDAEISRLEQQTDEPSSEADLLAETPPFQWERERKKLYRDGDYARLDRALELLRAVDADAYRALHAVYVYGWMQQTTPLVETLCARGLAFVDKRMPDPIRVPLRFQPDKAKGYVHRRRSRAA